MNPHRAMRHQHRARTLLTNPEQPRTVVTAEDQQPRERPLSLRDILPTRPLEEIIGEVDRVLDDSSQQVLATQGISRVITSDPPNAA